MKTIATTWSLIIGLMISSSALAQIPGFHYGFRAGFGETKMNIKGLSGEAGKLYVTGGLATNYQLTSMFGINADLMLSSRGGVVNGVYNDGPFRYEFEDRFSMFSSEIPVTAKFNYPIGDDIHLRAFAGPSINFNFSSTESRIYEDNAADNRLGYRDRVYNNTQFAECSFVYGAGLDIVTPNERIITLDVRGNNGFTPIGTFYGRNATLAGYALTVGFLF